MHAMEPSDARILLIVFALFMVTFILDPGPLRSYFETYLVLSLVPGLLTAIRILEFLGSGIDPDSWLFYVKLLWIVSTGYLSIVFYSWLKRKNKPNLAQIHRIKKRGVRGNRVIVNFVSSNIFLCC